MESYEIETADNTIEVSGRMKDDSYVEIRKNGDEYHYDREDGIYREGVTDASFRASDGTTIEEGVNTQTIELPDGTVIEKDVNERKATLPDGTEIKNLSTSTTNNTLNLNGIKIRHSSSSSVNIKIQSKAGNSYNVDTSNKDVKQEDIKLSEKTTDLIISLIPSFWIVMLTMWGILINSTAVFVAGIGLYLASIIPAIWNYLSSVAYRRLSNEADTQVEQLSTEEEIKKLQEKFAEGEISESAFDNQLQELLDDEENNNRGENNREKLELEKTTS